MHPGLPKEKRDAVFCISNCKTGGVGYNVGYCANCGKTIIHASSCNNRCCPCCQTPHERKWELERNTELIEGIAYYHVVFTLPHRLNHLIIHNPVPLLNLFFRCVHETLLTLCADGRFMGAKPGIVSVLHTWGQKLNYHPHIHVCVSGGGITPCGRFVETRHKGFFLPEAAVAKMFRGKFVHGLNKLYASGTLRLQWSDGLCDPGKWKGFISSLYEKEWVPFVKETFNGKGNAIKYLARYSYRTAISNSRIVSVDDDSVTFSYRDYADGNRQKLKTVKGTDFIGMFLQHVPPAGFHHVRFAGYLANCRRTRNLKLIHSLRGTTYGGNPYRHMGMANLFMTLYGRDICVCPYCSGQLLMLPRGMLSYQQLPHSIKSPSAVA